MAERPGLSGGDFTNSRRLYHGAASYVMGKKVLDFGCGKGHGTYFINPYTLSTVGFDLHEDSIEEARELFGSPTCRYTSNFQGVVNDRFDIIVSIEAIEHLEKQALVEKLALFSLMSPSIYATTPNGNIFPEPTQFHVCHYTEDELKELFGKYYEYVFIHGVLRDPNPLVNQFVGYAIFATNRITTPENFLHDYDDRVIR